MDNDLKERWEKYTQRTSSCWLWMGGLNDSGYGQIQRRRANGKNVPDRAHRVAWELFFGPIPKGLFVCHHCDNRRCVNPAHLFLGTQKDNMRDMARKGRWNNPQIRQTHCVHGHEFTLANTRIQDGKRVCRMCKSIWARQKAAKRTPEEHAAHLARRRELRRGILP